MNANDFVKLILRTPLRGIMGNTMLITVTGRKTGRRITTPVNYHREHGTLWVISNRSRRWWRNLTSESEIEVYVKGQVLKGTAELVLDQKAVADKLADYVLHSPLSARALGIKLQDGVVCNQDCERVAQDRLFVKVFVSDLD